MEQIYTKSSCLFHQFVVTSSAQQHGAQMTLIKDVYD
jgi:hypothetical protein